MYAVKLIFMIWSYFVLYEKLLNLHDRQERFYVRILSFLILFATACIAMPNNYSVNFLITFFLLF